MAEGRGGPKSHLTSQGVSEEYLGAARVGKIASREARGSIGSAENGWGAAPRSPGLHSAVVEPGDRQKRGADLGQNGHFLDKN